MKRKPYKLLSLLFISATALSNSISISAETAGEEPIYSLTPVIVTATRYAKNDMDIAASTEVYNKDTLVKTGAANIVSALSYTNGLTFMGYGPEGSSMGSKNSQLIIRGIDKGTLVMINGAPINLNGRYNLEDLPFDSISKVEIVKGGGSVLYGSEAIGGVINIITANELPGRLSLAVGNKDRQKYQLSTQSGKLSFAYSHNHWGASAQTSDLITSTKKMNNYVRDIRKNSYFVNYRFNNHSNLMYQHTRSKKDYDYIFGEGYDTLTGQTRYNRLYEYKKDFLQYYYTRNSLKGLLYYNQSVSDSSNTDFMSARGSKRGYPKYVFEQEKNHSYGGDLMKLWNTETAKYTLGMSFQHESYNPDTHADDHYSKNNYSIYAQYEKKLNERNHFLLSARETWAKMDEKTFNNFSGQMQYIYKLTANESVYASVGQSFRMPYLREMYSSGVNRLEGNTDLKPEKGVHYEMGWKKQHNDHLWKISLFKYYIKDNISYTLDRNGGKSYSTNQDSKNFGIEASVHYQNHSGLNYHLGLTVHDPKVKARSDNAPPTVQVKNYWDHVYGKVQISGGIGYEKDKWAANLQGTYMFNRVASPSSSPSFDIKPYFLTSLLLRYAPNENSRITLTMENLLNRTDNFGGSTTAYYSAPRSYMIEYGYKF